MRLILHYTKILTKGGQSQLMIWSKQVKEGNSKTRATIIKAATSVLLALVALNAISFDGIIGHGQVEITERRARKRYMLQIPEHTARAPKVLPSFARLKLVVLSSSSARTVVGLWFVGVRRWDG